MRVCGAGCVPPAWEEARVRFGAIAMEKRAACVLLLGMYLGMSLGSQGLHTRRSRNSPTSYKPYPLMHTRTRRMAGNGGARWIRCGGIHYISRSRVRGPRGNEILSISCSNPDGLDESNGRTFTLASQRSTLNAPCTMHNARCTRALVGLWAQSAGDQRKSQGGQSRRPLG